MTTREPKWPPEYVRDISEAVYRTRLEKECDGNVARMIEKDEDEGQMLRNRAGQYDPLTRVYLEVIGFLEHEESHRVSESKETAGD